jgi:hypothetical protein
MSVEGINQNDNTPVGADAGVEQVAQQPAAAEPVAPKQEDKFASKFAALTKKEREIQTARKMYEEQLSQFKQQQEQLEQMKQQIEQEKQSWKQRLKANPLKALEEEGFSYEDLNRIALNDSNPTVEMQMKMLKEEIDSKYQRELDSLKRQLQEKEESEAKTNLERQQIAYKHSLTDTIEKNAEKYELSSIYKDDAVSLAYDVTEQYYNEYGKVLKVDEALDLVEKYFEDEASKVLSAKKLAAKSTPKAPGTPSQNGENKSVTISNNMAAEVPRDGNRYLDRESSIKEAAKYIRFNA